MGAGPRELALLLGPVILSIYLSTMIRRRGVVEEEIKMACNLPELVKPTQLQTEELDRLMKEECSAGKEDSTDSCKDFGGKAIKYFYPTHVYRCAFDGDKSDCQTMSTVLKQRMAIQV